jgi:hypothetical protein
LAACCQHQLRHARLLHLRHVLVREHAAENNWNLRFFVSAHSNLIARARFGEDFARRLSVVDMT